MNTLKRIHFEFWLILILLFIAAIYASSQEIVFGDGTKVTYDAGYVLSYIDDMPLRLAIMPEPQTVTTPAEFEQLRQENEYLKRENCILYELISIYRELVDLLKGKS